jgi:hypothetical protein
VRKILAATWLLVLIFGLGYGFWWTEPETQNAIATGLGIVGAIIVVEVVTAWAFVTLFSKRF